MVDPLSQELLARLTRVEGDVAQATVSVGATAPSDPETGDLWYDTDYLALRVYDGTEWRVAGDHVLIPVHNDTGSTINRTRAVYVSGSNGGGVATVALARADSASTMPAIGLADQDIAPGADGFVLASGMFEDVNTSSFTSGDALYVSPTTAGGFTRTRPTDPAHLVQKVALITHANTNGAGIVMGAGRANDVNNEITALTGVALGDEDLGAFTGTTIPDDQTIKEALQSLETAVEAASGVTDHGALTGLSDDDHTQYLLADGTRALSGNLTVTGTVNGRDIAADGATLDTKTGTTGNYTVAGNWVFNGFLNFNTAIQVNSTLNANSTAIFNGQMRINSTLRPETGPAAAVDLGAGSFPFRNLFLWNQLRVGDDLLLEGDAVVDGNILVDGTVDGRDIATDGAKLDGIQAAVAVGSTAPVSPSGGDLWYHSTDQEMYAYDSSRSKWLSVTTYEAHFGQGGTLTSNHYMRGPGGFDYNTGGENGHPMRYNTTVIAAWGSAASGGTSGWNHRIMRWDDSAGANGVAASYAPSGTYTRWQKTDFNVDYDTNDLLALNMFDLGSATGVSNHTAVIAYKRRAS